MAPEMDKEEVEQNNDLEFNTHVCLQCKSCIEGLDQYVAHIKNGCSTTEEDEYIKSEDLKKKEHHLRKELSTLKINVVEKEGQLKDVQNKILRKEKTGHKVKTAQLKVKSEELANSKGEMKQLKLKYNKLLCYLKEKEQEVDQTEKKGDTPEKKNYQKSPKKVEKKPSFSKITTVKFSDKNISSEKRKEIAKEKNKSVDLQSSICNKPTKVQKEQINVMDSGAHLLESPSRKLACSETVCINLKESSIVGINPKHSKTNENECIKDNKHTFITKKGKHASNKPEKSLSLEPMPDYNTESTQFLVTQEELSTLSPSIIKDRQNLASKAIDSLDLYRTTKLSNDAESEYQSSSQDNSNGDAIKKNAQKNQCTNLEKTIKPIPIKVEYVEQKTKTFTNDSVNINESVVFLKQIQLPSNMNIVPRVSTPICKKEKLDFVDPELSAIISDEISPGLDKSVLILNTNNSEVSQESEGIIPFKKATINDSIINEQVNKAINFKEQKLKAQAKEENHNEAMILETDLDQEVLKINNRNQCPDNKNTSIYSPQDKMKTLSSISEGNFLTLSEISKSPTNTEISFTLNSNNKGDLDIAVGNPSKNKNLIRPDINKESNCLKKDDESETPKLSADLFPSSEESHDSQKQKSSTNKKSDNVEKPPTATVKPLNSEYSPSTKLDNETSRGDKRKLHPEGMGNKEKKSRINASNPKDGDWRFSNIRRGGSNASPYSGGRFRPNYDSNHYPRAGVLPMPYQPPYHQPWHPRAPGNYRGRMPNPNHYTWNYKW